VLKVSIASGKGGTGKTTVAVHLASWYSSRAKTVLADLDVDAPDCGAYFPDAMASGAVVPVNVMVPIQNVSLCTGCGACASICRFGALVAIKNVVTINPISCKGCGRCVRTCPAGALVEAPVQAGSISPAEDSGLSLVQGLLAVGDIRSTAVIEATKTLAESQPFDISIRDCPPGATCPTVRAVHGSDFCVLVAEPTRFSLHDLENALRMVRDLGIPMGLVINKAGAGDADPRALAARYDVPVLAELPWSLVFARAGAAGRLCMEERAMQNALDSIDSGIHRGLEARQK